MHSTSLITGLMLVFLLLVLEGPSSNAQTFPSKVIRFVLPYPPGGATDPLARTIGQKLTEYWGQQVVIDYRAGAGGTLASEVVAKTAPDGYTILLGSLSTLCMSPNFFKNVSVDIERDLAPITLLASGAFVLVVHPSLPVRSVKELIALARAKPGQLNYASGAIGGANHLAMELVKTVAGVDLVHIPYNGSGPALINVLSGQVPMMFGSVTSLLPSITTGRLKAVAVTTTKRSSIIPEVPTVAESGLAGFEIDSWYGVLAPAGTPRATISQLNRDIVHVLQIPEVKERLGKQGFETNSNTPEAFAKLIKTDIEKWAKVAKSSGARAD